MREENDLQRTNYLRFAIAALTALATVLCFLGVKRYLDWREEQQAGSTTTADTRTALLSSPKLDPPPKVEIHEFKQQTTAKTTAPPSPPVTETPPPPPVSAAFDTPTTPTVIRNPKVGALPPVSGPNGTITGHVQLEGTPPPEKVIDPLANDVTCGRLNSSRPTTRFYVVSPEGGLANVFVYLREPDAAGKSTSLRKPDHYVATPAVLEQSGCLFQPYVSGIMTGQSLKIKNDDPVLHNVHATPQANSEFNFAQPVQGQVNTRVFYHPEVMVRIKCDVHPWMFAYIGVVDHPYFAVTDSDGQFTITNVPPGNYEIEAVHLKAGRQIREVEAVAGAAQLADFSMSVPQ